MKKFIVVSMLALLVVSISSAAFAAEPAGTWCGLMGGCWLLW